MVFSFCFNDTATTEIYTLSLHDALPIYFLTDARIHRGTSAAPVVARVTTERSGRADFPWRLLGVHATSTGNRSEEHTSELQSPDHLVCPPLLDKTMGIENE